MGPQPKLDEHRENIIAAIQAAPSLTLDELRAKLDLPGCRTTLWKTLERGGQSLKRKVMFAAEQWRPDVQSKRRWWDIVVRGCFDRSQLRFIDETAITTHMGRREGRGPRGERVIAHEALGAWKTHTLLAAIRSSGWSAAMVLKGPVDADAFVTYVEQCLVPTLKHGEIVILDNVSSHHDDRVRPLIQRTGATLDDLPPYSPDLNPIENAFFPTEGRTEEALREDLRRPDERRRPSARCNRSGALLELLHREWLRMRRGGLKTQM